MLGAFNELSSEGSLSEQDLCELMQRAVHPGSVLLLHQLLRHCALKLMLFPIIAMLLHQRWFQRVPATVLCGCINLTYSVMHSGLVAHQLLVVKKRALGCALRASGTLHQQMGLTGPAATTADTQADSMG